MATQKTLEMEFATGQGRTHRMRVYDVKPTITASEISVAMDLIVTKNIFSTSSGELTGKVGAQVVTRDVEEFNLV
jgi:hypothetical protein